MSIPKVVIVGRPNVGKSSLLNWLAGKRISIVDPTSGVTRDRITYLMEYGERFFDLVDTGGMGVDDVDGLTDKIERQIQTALDEADVVLFVVDAKAGIVTLDEVVAKHVRKCEIPVLCLANKCDTKKDEEHAASEFYKFGRKLLFISTAQNKNKELVLEQIHKALPPANEELDPGVAMKIAVVGKRNVGKSTFINALAQSDRVIVSELPGTTRDSIDVRFEHDGRTFVAIDTAGVKKKGQIADSIEFYSYARAQRTIRRADVVLLFLDPTSRISKVEKQLSQYVAEQYKPCIFVVNKWDLMGAMPTSKYSFYVQDSFPTLQFAPRAFITATVGKNVKGLIDLATSMHKQSHARVSTGDLNRILRKAIDKQPPPTRDNKSPKIYYGVQAGVAPPTIVLFCNLPKLFDVTYQRYLLNVCRDQLKYHEVPIRLFLRKRTDDLGEFGRKDEEESPPANKLGDTTLPVS